MTSSWRSLEDVLSAAQRLGWLGTGDVAAVVAHAQGFLAVLTDRHGLVLDLGSGPGIPGLIIAQQRTDLEVVLLDRRAARIDFLTRAITALGMGDRVSAVQGEAPGAAKGLSRCADVVVARSFGSPEETLRCARPFLCDGGVLVVSEPPAAESSRWPQELVVAQGFSGPEHHGGVVMFHVEHSGSSTA